MIIRAGLLMTNGLHTMTQDNPHPCAQRGQETSVPKSSHNSNQWHSERRFQATYPPAGCRTFGKPLLGPCHFDDPHNHCGNNSFHTTHAENSPVRPRILTVVRPGRRTHLRKITILLNRRSVQTFEQLVADISEALGYPRWKNDRVKKLFNLKGREIRGVSDLFRSDEVFVASGRDKLSLQDIEEVLEELYPDSPGYHGHVLQNWERVLGQAVNASKADSGFHEELEPARNVVPAAAEGFQRAGVKACQEERQRARQQEKDRGEGRQGEKTQTRRAKEAFLPKVKIEKTEKLNAIYAPCTSYCKNCKRGRGGRQHGPMRGRVSSPTRDSQVGEEDQSLEMRRAPQRYSRSVHERPWERLKGRERNIMESQGRGDGSFGPKRKEVQSRKMYNDRQQDADEETPAGIKEPPEAEPGKAAHNPLSDGQTSTVKENSFVSLPASEHSPEQHGDKSLQENLEETKEGASEGKEPRKNLETGTQSENDLDAMLPLGPVSTQGGIEQLYDIGRVIGDGNFAVVRECRMQNSDTRYAMKIIDKEKLKGKEQMIQSEISIVRSLSHPHVVRLLRDYETEDQIYLLMEFVHGGDLFDAITENVKFNEHHTSLMIRDISKALAYIHSKSIVHRDLKPENLLVQHNPDGSSTLKLADFGLAMVVTEPIFTVCGTPTYVAPEILSEKGYGLPVDMWATGVILYILLCGFPPFRSQEKDQDELFELIQQGEYAFLPPYWDSISDGAKGLIRGLLLVDPGTRLTAEQVLRHPWVQSEAREGSLQEDGNTVNANISVSSQQSTEQ
ncbi:serine/threonine-protein kinase DCLK3 isoform X1 [Anguilla anguilla]|uniref:serine/threonine-protein kinase DCLK3 isoform X1 n=1 Tax=Anguilla anguilla TaxID=7936 RepID=UPI0015AC2611|nr:serine/threonine-protein kinase DCLK3 isoform X1 [Anguilla anguilla]